MIINRKRTHIKTTILITLLASVCMLTTSMVNGSVAYGAEAPAGDENFNYNGYSATQLKKISECISGVVPESECPSYEASSKDYYNGTTNHVNMPTGVISTKAGWLQWADAAMKANSYDGVYGTLRIASGGATGSTSNPTDVKFRLIGINQDNRADGTGKAGLTFQAIGHYHIESSMDTVGSGGWRDSQLRKKLNDESTGTIWNSIQSTDFKNNITPVLKTTNNSANSDSYDTSNALSITTDKLWILSPSEMSMPIINIDDDDANVHYYDVNSLYRSTIKLSKDDNFYLYIKYNYLYAGNAYQWWMLPAGSRKMNNGNQAYHNTDSYSYCVLLNAGAPSNKECRIFGSYWLRSHLNNDYFAVYRRTRKYKPQQHKWYKWSLLTYINSSEEKGVVVSFSF